jgi:hypothetical protein
MIQLASSSPRNGLVQRDAAGKPAHGRSGVLTQLLAGIYAPFSSAPLRSRSYEYRSNFVNFVQLARSKDELVSRSDYQHNDGVRANNDLIARMVFNKQQLARMTPALRRKFRNTRPAITLDADPRIPNGLSHFALRMKVPIFLAAGA